MSCGTVGLAGKQLAGSSATNVSGHKDRPDMSSHQCEQCSKSTCECDSCADSTHACRQCGKLFLSNEFFVRHVLNVHLKSTSHKKVDLNPYDCRQCAFHCTTLRDLRRHAGAVHQHERPFACTQCGVRFSKAANLRRHTSVVHLRQRPHACRQCNKQFAEAGNLWEHIRVMHMCERPHACQQCTMRFAVAGKLSRHIRVRNSTHVGNVSSSSPRLQTSHVTSGRYI